MIFWALFWWHAGYFSALMVDAIGRWQREQRLDRVVGAAEARGR